MPRLEHHFRQWLLRRKAGLVSVHCLPSSCRETIPRPITKERMNKWVFTHFGNNTWVQKKDPKRESLNQVCKMTTDDHGLLPGYTVWFTNQQASLESCLETQSLRRHPRPIHQALHFKDDPQVIGVWIMVWETSWPLNVCVTFFCSPANASSRALQSRECDIRPSLVKLQTVDYFVTYKNGNFKWNFNSSPNSIPFCPRVLRPRLLLARSGKILRQPLSA